MQTKSQAFPLAMPLIKAHWGYFQNFIRSLTSMLENKSPLHLILMVRAEEYDEIKNRVYTDSLVTFPGPITILKKSDFIGHRPNMRGCYRAMACKLAVSRYILDHFENPYYLAVDADLLVTQPISLTTLLTHANLSKRHRPHFYEIASMAVGEPVVARNRTVSLCPPFLYRADYAQGLIIRMRDLQGRRVPMDGIADPWAWTDPCDILWSDQAPWADPFLYNTYVNPPVYHMTPKRLTDDPLEGLNLTNCRPAFDAWKCTGDYPFAVIHSHTQIPPEDIWKKYQEFNLYA
jgi:hypothetical protein